MQFQVSKKAQVKKINNDTGLISEIKDKSVGQRKRNKFAAISSERKQSGAIRSHENSDDEC